MRLFTLRYGVKLLVYYEDFGLIGDAIQREKRIKEWRPELVKSVVL